MFVKEFFDNPRSTRLSTTNKASFTSRNTTAKSISTASPMKPRGSSKFSSNASFLGSFNSRNNSRDDSRMSKDSHNSVLDPAVTDKEMNEMYVHLESLKSEIEVLKLTKDNIEASFRSKTQENLELKRKAKIN